MKKAVIWYDVKNSEIKNIIQYSILAIFPIVILNKTIQRFIPEADETKGSIEVLIEIILQLGLIFVGMFFIHRIITYIPTYSESKYDNLSVVNNIISFLIIILSLQTKLGEKMNIIIDRILSFIDNINEIIKDEELKINLINIINNKYIIINEVINSNLQLYSCLAEICDFNNKVLK